jgi:ATP-dependent Clp protease, protease subunit
MIGDRAVSFDSYLQNQLFERRIVLAQGPLDADRATSVSAQLLTLEALAAEPIRLHLASPGGDLLAALSLVDTIGVLGVELTAVAVGEVSGAAVAPFAAAPRRLAYPHARFGLKEPEGPSFEGSATEIGSRAEDYLSRHQAFLEVLAEATGRQPEALAADLRTGRYLTAEQAIGYGLVSEIAQR